VAVQAVTTGFSPKAIHDSVDIVKDATPSIKANADNTNAYFEVYPDAPSRERYTL
jgi:hypothetical protein